MPKSDSHRIFARRLQDTGLVLCLSGFFLLLFLSGHGVGATTASTVVIRDDRGGRISDRAQVIDHYRQAGTRIEIRGKFCMSACTMYLSLKNTCISPTTLFGFHGPSSPLYGIALSPELFEASSQMMADHYPEPIRTWFLQSGRHRTVGFHEYRGSDLIELGITGCAGLNNST